MLCASGEWGGLQAAREANQSIVSWKKFGKKNKEPEILTKY
jgi:hypothetical protein